MKNVLVWGKRLSLPFRKKLILICNELNINPNWLISCMAFETGETFSPSIVNKVSGATGLIQFMPSTARSLGTTTEALKKLSDVQQLDYVLKYFLPYKNRIKNLEDCYMAILFPVAIGKPLDYPLFIKNDSRFPKRYIQNNGLDKNKDGVITKAEATGKVWEKYEKGLLPNNVLITETYITPNPSARPMEKL